jgi:hypothetical protein
MKIKPDSTGPTDMLEEYDFTNAREAKRFDGKLIVLTPERVTAIETAIRGMSYEHTAVKILRAMLDDNRG